MATGFVWEELYGWHSTGSNTGQIPSSSIVQPYQHFESPETKVRFASLVEVSGLAKNLVRIPVIPATEEDLLRVHTQEHLDRIKRESLNPKVVTPEMAIRHLDWADSKLQLLPQVEQ